MPPGITDELLEEGLKIIGNALDEISHA